MTEINKVQKKYLSWNDFEEMIADCSASIQNEGFVGVYGIPRGGLVMATVLSNRLGLPMLQAPCKNCLVVDDIADTGVTLKHFEECGYKIMTWGHKEKSIVKPWLYHEDWEESDWIVFPWED